MKRHLGSFLAGYAIFVGTVRALKIAVREVHNG